MKKIISLVIALALMACTAITFTSCVPTEESDPVVKVINIPLTVDEYAFAVPKGDTEMLTALNDFLAEIQNDGTFDEIINKYFGDGTPTPVTSAAQMNNDGSQLIVATNAAFAPFEYMEGENYYGVDLEIMALFAEHLDKELYIYNMNFDAVCLAVSNAGGTYEDEDGNIIMTEIATIPSDEALRFDYVGCDMYQLWVYATARENEVFAPLRENERFIRVFERLRVHDPYEKYRK